MKAIELAMKLLLHPEADVMIVDDTPPNGYGMVDFDFVRGVRYYEEHDRFHLDWKKTRRNARARATTLR